MKLAIISLLLVAKEALALKNKMLGLTSNYNTPCSSGANQRLGDNRCDTIATPMV